MKYLVVNRNELPYEKDCVNINDIIDLIGKYEVINEEFVSDNNEICYLAYGPITKEVINGKVIPNRAIHPWNDAKLIGGVIWYDTFIIVKKDSSGYTGLLEHELDVLKNTYGVRSINQAKKLGFLP